MEFEHMAYQWNWTKEGSDVLFTYLIGIGLLVPVERCKHGNIDGHMVTHFNTASWCPGAGIGDTDDSV